MDKKFDYDFSGWATCYNVKCSDGRTIRCDAFAEDDGMIVPLTYEFDHRHQDVTNVLGKALLCNRPEGVYTYCKFNDAQKGQIAKGMVQLGFIRSLGIYAINIKQTADMNVVHGSIKEVSLVNFPANPGAVIDYVAHNGTEETQGGDI